MRVLAGLTPADAGTATIGGRTQHRGVPPPRPAVLPRDASTPQAGRGAPRASSSDRVGSSRAARPSRC
ncbi:hypothetical protein [Aeromicrobium halocynthiae]|uniref:hypothetical protein n=1 Tax=Aeromicrobium halocynthiae TaxID=560557 RepID=UPI0031E41352